MTRTSIAFLGYLVTVDGDDSVAWTVRALHYGDDQPDTATVWRTDEKLRYYEREVLVSALERC